MVKMIDEIEIHVKTCGLAELDCLRSELEKNYKDLPKSVQKAFTHFERQTPRLRLVDSSKD